MFLLPITAQEVISEIDLLKAIGIPKDNSIRYTDGSDGYPAFHLNTYSEIRRSSYEFFGQSQTLPSDFAIVILTKPDYIEGGHLFSVVSPAQTIIIFGVMLTSYGSQTQQNVVLYYTENAQFRAETVVLANFTIPSTVGQWARLGIQIVKSKVSLYLNCEKHDEVNVKRSYSGLAFQDGSTLYVGQAGPNFPEKYSVS